MSNSGIYEVTAKIVVQVYADSHDDAVNLVDDSVRVVPLNETSRRDDILSFVCNTSGSTDGASVRFLG